MTIKFGKWRVSVEAWREQDRVPYEWPETRRYYVGGTPLAVFDLDAAVEIGTKDETNGPS